MDTMQSYRSRSSAFGRRRFLGTSAAIGAGLTAAALVGCSSTGGKPTTSTAPGSKAGGAKGPTAAEIIGKNWGNREPDVVPKYGGTLTYADSVPALAHLD